MDELLAHLREHSYTLTLYNHDETVDDLSRRLAQAGVAVRSDETASGHPSDFGVLHRGGDVLGAASLSELTVENDSDLLDGDRERSRPALLEAIDSEVSISPEIGHRAMVRISREFERRAWRHGEGDFYAGFQDLSALAESGRTLDVYDRLASTDVSVTVYGYPDDDLGTVPYEVVEDDEELFREYWFLLYDGDDPAQKAAMVSREENPSQYDAYWTVEPGTVDTLLEIAVREYPGYFQV